MPLNPEVPVPIEPVLLRHPGVLPAPLVDALVSSAVAGSLTANWLPGLLIRPELTTEHTGRMLDAAVRPEIAGRYYTHQPLKQVCAAHVKALGVTPALTEFVVWLERNRVAAPLLRAGSGNLWTELLNQAFGQMTVAQETYLASGENLLAAALFASQARRWDRVEIIARVHELLPSAVMDEEDRGLTVAALTKAIQGVRAWNRWAGEKAVLSATTDETLRGVGEGGSSLLTPTEADHLVRVRHLPALDAGAPDAIEDAHRFVANYGDRLSNDSWDVLAGHPALGGLLDDAAATARNLGRSPSLWSLHRELPMARTARLVEELEDAAAEGADWSAMLTVLNAAPSELTVQAAAGLVQTLLS